MKSLRIISGPPTICPRCKKMFNSDIVHSRRSNSDALLCPPCRKNRKREKKQKKADT